MLALFACAAPGCGAFRERFADGARTVFVSSNVCPAARVKVIPRPDIAPHVVYASSSLSPPPEVASDPARMRLWEHQNSVDVDAIGKSYEVSGCGTRVMYVCAHPWLHRSFGPFSAEQYEDADGVTQVKLFTENYASSDNTTLIEGDEVLSTIVCVTGS
jgi:hypothetical protein